MRNGNLDTIRPLPENLSELIENIPVTSFRDLSSLVEFLIAMDKPFLILRDESIIFASKALRELLIEMGYNSEPHGANFREYFRTELKHYPRSSSSLEPFKFMRTSVKLPVSEEEKEFVWLSLSLPSINGILLILKNDTELGVDCFRQNIVNNLSHELRTPLTILKGMLDYLLNPMASKMSREELVNHLKVMMQKTQELEGLIHELLEIVKLERGDLKFKKYWFPIYPLLDRLVTRYTGRAKKFKVEVFKELDIPESLEIYADAARVNYLVNELLDNALKFSLEGGKIKFKAYLTDSGTELILEVIDTGIGIPEAHKDKVFNPFFRGDNRPNRRVYGVGLGLFIVRKIVEGHNGTIELYSKEGKGTRVKVTLPNVRTI